jgi:hypothetical protein
MFGRVHHAFHPQNLLRPWNPQVVDELVTVMPKPGTIPGARESRHPRAAAAAVKVQAKPRPPTSKRPQIRRQNLIEIGIPLKDGSEPFFHHDSQPQIRTEPL